MAQDQGGMKGLLCERHPHILSPTYIVSYIKKPLERYSQKKHKIGQPTQWRKHRKIMKEVGLYPHPNDWIHTNC